MSEAEEQKRQYDAACKNVLSEKGIIANILQDCVGEFQTCSIDEIVNRCIEGQPETGTVVVEPNGGISRITSQQVEDKSEREGTVFYDIRFTAVAPSDGKPIRLIINIEAQNNFHPGYPLLKRAIYYCSRMISSQYGTVFTKSHYEKIEKVYSIWICTMPTKKWAYTITRYRMREENLVGQTQAPREDYDLLTPILVCLGSKQYTELKGLLRMLNLVLLDNVSPESKTKTLKEEFHVQVTPHLEKGVAEMCNLSEGIEKRGEARGEARGQARGDERRMKIVATNMIRRGKYSPEEIADISGMALEKVRELMDGKPA
jgi:hypothetical protein